MVVDVGFTVLQSRNDSQKHLKMMYDVEFTVLGY